MSKESRNISFTWNNITYSESIDGELELRQLTPMEVRSALNKAVGQYAYYSSVLADAVRLGQGIVDDFEQWQAERYSTIDSEEPKKTEGWKKSRIQIEFSDAWKEWKQRQRQSQYVIDMLKTLIRSYEHQMRVLQTISAMMRVELERATYSSGEITDAEGSRDLHDVENF